MVSEELKIIVRAEASNAVRELKQLEGTTQKVSFNFKDIAKSLIGPIGVTAGIALLTSKISQGVRSSIQYAASVEKMSVAFEVLLGSATKAESVLSEIRKFSASTPFQFQNLAGGAKRLMAFGTAAEDVVDVMRDLGNAAMGDQAILDRLTLAYGKLQAKGKASLEELNMFTEAGVPILKALQEQLGLTQEALFEYITQGKVGFEDVNEALQNLTRGEGQFAGMLERQSQTLEGAMSTLTDNVKELGRALSESLLPRMKELLDLANDIVNRVTTRMSGTAAIEAVTSSDFLTFLTKPNTEARYGEVAGKRDIVATALSYLQNVIEANIGNKNTTVGIVGKGLIAEAQRGTIQSEIRNILTIIDQQLSGLGRAGFGRQDTDGGGGMLSDGIGAGTGTREYTGQWWANNPFIGPTSMPLYQSRPFATGTQGLSMGAALLPWAINPVTWGGSPLPFESSDYSANNLAAQIQGRRREQAAADFRNMDLSTQEWNVAGQIKDISEAMGEMLAKGAMAEGVALFEGLGAALAAGGDSTQVLINSLKAIASQLSSIFLWGAQAAFKRDQLEIGIGFLVAAGVSGFLSGVIGGGRMSGPSRSSGTSSTISSQYGTVHGLGTNIQNPTIVQNIQGSVWSTGELKTLAAGAARDMHSGR